VYLAMSGIFLWMTIFCGISQKKQIGQTFSVSAQLRVIEVFY